MTDLRGRGARWTAAVVAAPVAAGLFAVATTWTLQHDPLAPAATVAAPVVPPDPAVIGMRRTAMAQQKELVRLDRKVRSVRRLAKAERARLRSSGATSSGTGSSSAFAASSGSSSGGSTSVTVSIPAPVAAPPAHTTTGASGAKKP